MLRLIFSLLALFEVLNPMYGQKEVGDWQQMLHKINELRTEGCNCGNKYAPPVDSLSWNLVLQKSALSHAKDMYSKRYFSHYSQDGKDIGERISSFGYSWRIVGENIGEGQNSFDEVFRDWKKSPTHCLMMMDERVSEIGIAFYRGFWVQHFARPQ